MALDAVVVRPVVPPLIVTVPALGVMLPESPSTVVIAPDAETAWKDGKEEPPVEVRTNPEVDNPVVADCNAAVVVVPPHNGA